jgi:hypothetical protein
MPRPYLHIQRFQLARGFADGGLQRDASVAAAVEGSGAAAVRKRENRHGYGENAPIICSIMRSAGVVVSWSPGYPGVANQHCTKVSQNRIAKASQCLP